MGLYISSLATIPVDAERRYFIYLLDYGWEEELGKTLLKNYEKMAVLAAENDAVIIRGTNRVHFQDQVLSWHNFNGEDAEELLPAILITNRNPHRFKESFDNTPHERIEADLKMILIPLRKFCTTTTDVVVLIDKLFNDIKEKKDLNDFRIAREMKKGFGRSLADAIILEPNIGGFGFNFNKMIEYFLKK
jgi:hypothetical protein